MIVAYDEFTYTFVCMVFGCVLLIGPFVLIGIAAIIQTIMSKIKKGPR